MVESTYPHSDQAMLLRRELGPYADVLPIRLWCWGITTDRENGTFQADAKQIAHIVQFESDPEVLLEIFLRCGVIEKLTTDGHFRIKGWDRNKRFFSERKRLRKARKNAKSTRAKRVRDANKTEPSSSSSSSSSPHSLITKNGEDPPINFREAASAEFDGRDDAKPATPRATRGFPEAALEAEFIERGQASGVTVAKFSALERSIGGQLVRRCGENGITQAKLIAEWWRPEWRVCGLTVQQLDRHFASVRAAIADPKLRPKPKRDLTTEPPTGFRVIPSVEETSQRNAERNAPIDPEQHAKTSAALAALTRGQL